MSSDELFTAKLAYDCLISAPFNATVALAFLSYYNDTIQFQSTLAYLKDPPPSYQQPSIDVQASLNTIAEMIEAGEFENEYVFEVAVQAVLYATHDDHVTLSAGILSAFTFGSPYSIVSASTDGIELPKVYIEGSRKRLSILYRSLTSKIGDIIEAIDQDVDWVPSAISKINGNDTIEFLSAFAAINSPGNVEPHGDWNGLMSSGAGDVQGIYSAFEGNTIFYPGENITFTFENGTVLDSIPWLAQFSDLIINSPPILSSGQDFYEYFVLGTDPPSDAAAAATTTGEVAAATSSATASISNAAAATTTVDGGDASATGTPDATPSSWDEIPFPTNPVISQPNLGLLSGGVITGYFLNDGVTAVISIPSFDVTSEAVLSFSTTIGQFLNQSKAAGLTRFIVDVQRNAGGSELLATDAFKQFFPSIDPFGGSRLRANPMADALGNTLTKYYTETQDIDPDFYDELSADIWVAPVYINAETGQNFTDWPEFFGPHPDHGGQFTTIQRNNLSSIIFDVNASGDDEDNSNGIVVYGFGNRSSTSPQPYAAEQIVILTDAYCSSACAIFVELMHHQAGVRTVVAGGRPDTTPMQAVGGSRGAQVYSSIALDADIDVAEFLNSSLVLPDRDAGNYINYAGFNIKDQIRKGEDFPLQFAFEPATCRIFYTVHTVYNYLNLWNYVVDAIWRNPSLCIAGSANGTLTADPTNETGPATNSKVITETENISLPDLILNGLSSGPQFNSSSKAKAKRSTPPTPTTTTDLELADEISDGLLDVPTCKACDTRNNQVCAPVPTCTLGKLTFTSQCVKGCSKRTQSVCGATQHCKLDSTPSFCFDNRAQKAVGLCKTPTRNLREQQTRAVGGGNGASAVHLQYSRSGLRGSLRPP